MDWKVEYERWMSNANLDAQLKQQLLEMQDDEKQLEDCFYQHLTFGTGGIRGVIGPGTNRMNVYTIRKASEGLARYIEEQGEEAKARGVVIAYDSRHKSPEFAMEAALTLGNHGIKTYVFDELRPTPELSFAVRYLHAYAGIVVTASHNPPEYNGYKVYGPDGGQIPPAAANEIISKVNEVGNELEVEIANEQELKEQDLLTIIGEHIDRSYNENLKKLVLNPHVIEKMAEDVNIVFTPLHGTANKPVRRGLEAIGFKNVTIVTEQEKPDSNFSTVKAPNPEEHAAFEYAIRYGKEVNADILIGTDPDADRLGIAVKNYDGDYVVLTGNQTGALMLHYLLSQKKEKGILPANGIVLKTIVTSEIGRAIATDYGLQTIDTLTGFKFIGEKIKEYEETKEYTFQFGYEESYGYLIGDFARDKDAVQASLLAAEMCAYYKEAGKSLYEQLMEIFKQYGYYREGLESLTLKGKEGAEQIADLLAYFRENPPAEIGNNTVVIREDYEAQKRVHVQEKKEETIELPNSNVLKYFLSDGSWVCLRPSGTEPKVKFYFGIKGTSLEDSETKLSTISADLMKKVNKFLEEN